MLRTISKLLTLMISSYLVIMRAPVVPNAGKTGTHTDTGEYEHLAHPLMTERDIFTYTT